MGEGEAQGEGWGVAWVREGHEDGAKDVDENRREFGRGLMRLDVVGKHAPSRRT